MDTPVDKTSNGPSISEKTADSQVHEEHGHRIIEKSQNVDRVNPVRSTAHEHKGIGRHL